MKKQLSIIFCLFFTISNIFAGKPIHRESSPLSIVTSESEKKRWCEHDGYALIMGQGNLHYWLYDSYKYHNGDISELLENIVYKWFQNSLGYFVVEKYEFYSPNKALADSVKNLMAEFNCDVSITFIPEKNGGFASVVFNSYDKDTGIYSTYVYKGTKVDR